MKAYRHSEYAKRQARLKQDPTAQLAERETARKWATKNRAARPERWLLKAARHRARVSGIPFDIDVSDVRIPSICPILGIEIRASVGKAASHSPSLDRVIPELGYVKGNVRVISHRANAIKNDALVQEVAAVQAYVIDHIWNQYTEEELRFDY